jgi:hypothetical protein
MSTDISIKTTVLITKPICFCFVCVLSFPIFFFKSFPGTCLYLVLVFLSVFIVSSLFVL